MRPCRHCGAPVDSARDAAYCTTFEGRLSRRCYFRALRRRRAGLDENAYRHGGRRGRVALEAPPTVLERRIDAGRREAIELYRMRGTLQTLVELGDAEQRATEAEAQARSLRRQVREFRVELRKAEERARGWREHSKGLVATRQAQRRAA